MKYYIVKTNKKTGGKFRVESDIFNESKNIEKLKELEKNKLEFSTSLASKRPKKFQALYTGDTKEETIQKVINVFNGDCIGFNKFTQAAKSELFPPGDCVKTTANPKFPNKFTGYYIVKQERKGATSYIAVAHDFNIIKSSTRLMVMDHSDLKSELKQQDKLICYIGRPRIDKTI